MMNDYLRKIKSYGDQIMANLESKFHELHAKCKTLGELGDILWSLALKEMELKFSTIEDRVNEYIAYTKQGLSSKKRVPRKVQPKSSRRNNSSLVKLFDDDESEESEDLGKLE